MSPRKKVLSIGCASGFWGDTETAAWQLVHRARPDYLVFDYLAEITLSIMAGARLKDPRAGFATDFVGRVMEPLLPDLVRQRIRVVSNAGGMNPLACRDALAAAAARHGLPLRIAVVLGDDLLPRYESLRAGALRGTDASAAAPSRPVSANAYLGAWPIARALALGADVVITGRIVDSALALGPLIHEHGWSPTDYDRLAQGSLAGHLIECGAQSTGGNFTDWEQVPGYADMGFPIVECEADGTFVLTKPGGTGGMVTAATVAEQLVYEIDDPCAYVLPDVVCDFSRVELTPDGDDRIRVSGARGAPPTDTYKVSTTWPDGFRCTAAFLLAGRDARRKGERTARALLDKLAQLFVRRGYAPLRATQVDVLGAESTYGPHARHRDGREVIVRIAATHAEAAPLELFSREIAQAATAMAPGIAGLVGGRPSVSPVLRLWSALLPKDAVEVAVDVDGATHAVSPGPAAEPRARAEAPSPDTAAPPSAAGTMALPLIELALARSGDKGDSANIGVIARRPDYLPWLRAALTEQAVAEYFAHVLDPRRGRVRRYELPGIHALNFVLEHALGGGGVASLRADPQGKALAQQLLEFPVPVPREFVAHRPSP